MAGRKLPPEKVRAVAGFLAAGMNPSRASRAAGVPAGFAYRLDREVSGGVSRLAVKREAAAARAEERAARAAAGRVPADRMEKAHRACPSPPPSAPPGGR